MQTKKDSKTGIAKFDRTESKEGILTYTMLTKLEVKPNGTELKDERTAGFPFQLNKSCKDGQTAFLRQREERKFFAIFGIFCLSFFLILSESNEVKSFG